MPTRARADFHHFWGLNTANLTGWLWPINNKNRGCYTVQPSPAQPCLAWLNQIPLRLIRLSAPTQTTDLARQYFMFSKFVPESLSLFHTDRLSGTNGTMAPYWTLHADEMRLSCCKYLQNTAVDHYLSLKPRFLPKYVLLCTKIFLEILKIVDDILHHWGQLFSFNSASNKLKIELKSPVCQLSVAGGLNMKSWLVFYKF